MLICDDHKFETIQYFAPKFLFVENKCNNHEAWGNLKALNTPDFVLETRLQLSGYKTQPN